MEVDEELLVPDPGKSLAEGAISPWTGAHTSQYFTRLLESLADEMGFDIDKPFGKLPLKVRRAVLHGVDEQVHVRYKNRYGRQRSYYATFEGVVPYVKRRHSEAETDTSRERFEGYMRQIPCGCL